MKKPNYKEETMRIALIAIREICRGIATDQNKILQIFHEASMVLDDRAKLLADIREGVK